ncbi:hypothetical protein KOW79_006929 [Hemibagrus wyckioides]|uniref:Ig-like domain-containing protein n=1 Tax=Hemibagrus wyckioides TaxID=337641 RepID=A0A9D3P1C1_9TELE|nr:hypothetical protein KOW79_006929 [Hemibagrus wyckioides]
MGQPSPVGVESDSEWENVVRERPPAVLSVSPQSWLTEGDSVTLSCEVTDSSTDWTFSWYTVVPYRDGLTGINNNGGYSVYVELLSDSSRGSGGNYTLSPAALNHTGVYMCRGERGEPALHSQYSNPQPLWITGEAAAENNKATYTQVKKKKKTNRNNASAGADADVTYAEIQIKPKKKAKRIKEKASVADDTVYSAVKHNMESWLTEGDSVTLSCEVTDSSTDWTFSWYTVVPYRDGLTGINNNGGYSVYVELLSDSSRGSGGKYTLSPAALKHTGVYMCRGERGEPALHSQYSNPQPLWITDGDVILESPVHPVTEGHPLTLRCLYHNPNPSNLRADFYKDGSVLQNQTTGEMIIQTVSKSDEGFYHCKHPERGESLKSWLLFRFSGSTSSGLTVGLVVGLGFLFIAFLILMILLWFCKRKKEKASVADDTVYSAVKHNME